MSEDSLIPPASICLQYLFILLISAGIYQKLVYSYEEMLSDLVFLLTQVNHALLAKIGPLIWD